MYVGEIFNTQSEYQYQQSVKKSFKMRTRYPFRSRDTNGKNDKIDLDDHVNGIIYHFRFIANNNRSSLRYKPSEYG